MCGEPDPSSQFWMLRNRIYELGHYLLFTCASPNGIFLFCVFQTVINITYPNFSGTDSFGYTSFLAYSAIPNISLYYEFQLKFQLANHNSSLKDNLIFFTGQKGQGKLFVFLWGGSVIQMAKTK